MAYSNTTYKSRSMRQRRGTDKWEVRLTHKNPLTNEIETSYQPTRLTREFRTFCDTNGFQNIQFHDLRHTFASMLIADSVDVRTVASYLGHTNVAMTLNTYAEVDPEAKRAAVGRIQAAFDIEESEVFKLPSASPEPQYTVAQLEAMLAEARKREGLEGVA